MTEKAATEVWVVYRMEEGAPSFLGAYETKQAAEDDLQYCAPGFVTSCVMLLGWAFNRDSGKIYRNSDPSPALSETKQ